MQRHHLVPEDAQGCRLPPAETPHARAARGETFSLEVTLPAVDGSRRWYEANGQPLHNGRTGHAVVVIGAFVVLAVNGYALDLSALIGLLMLRGIVVTNAIVLLALVQHKIEAGADLRRARTDAGNLIGEIAGGGKAIVVVVEQSELGGHEGVRDGRRRIRLAHGLMGPGGMDGSGSLIEIAMIGNEGMVGLPVFLDTGGMLGQAFVQIPVTGLRMPAPVSAQWPASSRRRA